MEGLLWKCLVLVIFASVAQGWKNKDKIKLSDVEVLTLRHGRMTNGRRASPVPQIKCVGGSAGCDAFVPKVVQCYNRGSDGYDVQWECKADMDNKYKFGEIAVNCEGYDYPDDPYILKGSCGLEYSLDYVGGDHGQSYDSRYDSHQSYHGNHDNRKHHRNSSGWMSTFIMWGVIAFIVYYIYTTYCANQTSTDGTQSTYQSASSAPPPPGFRPEYTQGHSEYPSTSSSTDSGYGGFWTGMGLGGLTGYLFGNRGYGNTGYSHRHGNPYYSQGDGWFGGNSWFGGNQGNTGWFGGNRGNTGWFGNGSSGWSSTHRRSGSSPSSSGSRTASGFGGTKRR